MFSASEIIFGNVLPPLIALVVLFLAAQPWRRADNRRGAWGGPLAVGIAALLALGPDLGIKPAVSPKTLDQWMYLLVGIAIVIGLIESLLRPKLWVIAIVMLLFSAGVVLCMIPAATRDAFDASHRLLWMGGGAVALTAWWLMLETLTRKAPSPLAATMLGFVAGGSGLLLLMTLSISSGRFGAAIAGAAAMALLVTLVLPKLDLTNGTSLVLVVATGSQLITAIFRAPDELPLTPAMLGLLFLAPGVALIVVFLPGLGRAARWTAAILAIVVPIGVAVGLAAPKFIKSIDESSQGE
jgi:hypothetical protein